MADNSSFMDWVPQTPPPLFNPYQGDYMPGGWPQQPPTPQFRTTGLFDPVRRRTRLEEFLLPVLPAAKRVCRGLIRATINATATVVTVPTYAIVRQVRHMQRARRADPPPQQAPRNRAVQARPARRVVIQTPPPRTPQQQETVLITPPSTPPPQETVRFTLPKKQIQEDVATEEIPFEVPEFRPARLLRPTNKHVTPKKVIRRRRLKDAFPGMPQIPPPQTLKSVTVPTPEHVVRKTLPEAGSVRLHSPFPQFAPGPTAPSSPPSPAASVATTESVTPSAQLQNNLSTATESDSEGNTVVSSVTTSRKRRIDIQGSRAIEGNACHSAKRFQTAGLSVDSPNTPTTKPIIVVQAAVVAADAEAPPTPLNSSLLSPSRFKDRKFHTPKPSSKISAKVCKTPPSAQSFISSTCDISPGNYHLDDVRSPVKGEISSFFQGTPPPFPEQDADVFRMITAGGGSPIPASKNLAEREETKEPIESNTGDGQVQSSGERSTGNKSAVQESEEEEQHSVVAPAEDDIEITDIHSGPATQGDIPEPNITTEATERISSEDDKEAPVTAIEETTSTPSPAIDLRDENEDGDAYAFTTDSALQAPEKKLAQLKLDDDKYRTPEKPTPKASPHSVERTTRRTRAEAKRELLAKEKHLYNIAELAAEWEDRIQLALQHGHGNFKASDFTRVVPLSSNNRGTDRWLNDEVINGYLALVVKHGRQNDRPSQVPSYHAFSSFFFNNLEEKGHDGVKRWASRAKIGGKALLETEAVFIPINSGAHWTLLVVLGKTRSATHYNSMAGSGRRYIAAVKTWLAGELGSQYKEEEWTFVERGESPMQSNMDDCGVFAITSARQIMLGLTPMSYGPEMIPLQRKRIVAELVAGELLKSEV
ncbi:hypothetical protein A1O7_03281 [Cladophialophora yegresii CBS 114405]|uniref:Ubiquitin-like protease family profile domain-containing protein n=1 Tax=Cladophialophora yegresii CBS 114405 TaxID=1182544 RepID=W9WCY2_9EURO|nr:uncharacterized protein A1O7_03281 [Cladophialophora yegresii CBS 114405]EXJ62840.1 hypothetical protein A1O7_03281 [Cladophialophora yegresii CBS 114405]